MVGRSRQGSTLFLVDGTSNLFRAFHAIRELSNSRGLPTNAVFGFTTMLRKLIKSHEPEYLAVAFDLAEPTFRHRLYPEYKANRAETPEALVAQIPYVKRICEALRVPVLEKTGFEADDLIGTVAERAHEKGFSVVVVASDKDLLQLVREGIVVYNPVNEQFLDAAAVESSFGVRPSQVPDVLALWGDSSDNIPGVPGIGEKGAKDLIRRFGHLEAVLEGAASVERKSYREGLQAHAEAARMSLALATLRLDVPLAIGPEGLRLGLPDSEAMRDLLRELEFTAMLQDYTAPLQAPRGTHEVLHDAASLERAVERLLATGVVAINLERDHAEPMRSTLVGIAMAGGDGAAYYVPLDHRSLGASRQIAPTTALELIAPLLTGEGIRRIGHNVKSDLVMLRWLKQGVGRFDLDTMLGSYLLNPSRRSHGLGEVAKEFGGLEVPTYESLLGAGARRRALADADLESTAALVCARMSAVIAIDGPLRKRLEGKDLLALLEDLELPLTEVLADAESLGVGIDVGHLEALSSAWETELQEITRDIHALAGGTFNINSPRQLAEVLFEGLKLRPGKRTRKTRSLSTGADVLEELAEAHALPRRVLEHRTLQKLKSTYVDSLPQLLNPRTGRVHTTFNQAVAATGRLSSSEPNLQNIPVRSELGRQIRRAFVPTAGSLLMSADYSQIELRIMAHLSGDPALVEAFRRGEDVHRRTAAELFGVLADLVTDEMRRRAKAVNFGVIYGMGAQRLAREQGMALKEATQFIKRYFQRFPRVKSYIDVTVRRAEEEGLVRTLFGRLRYLPEIRGADRNARQQAIRAAVNTTIQGTAADLIKRAMIALSRRLRGAKLGARIIMQVHDELVLEVPESEVIPVGALLREVMEGVHALDVPLITDLKVGWNWLQMESLSLSKD